NEDQEQLTNKLERIVVDGTGNNGENDQSEHTIELKHFTNGNDGLRENDSGTQLQATVSGDPNPENNITKTSAKTPPHTVNGSDGLGGNDNQKTSLAEISYFTRFQALQLINEIIKFVLNQIIPDPWRFRNFLNNHLLTETIEVHLRRRLLHHPIILRLPNRPLGLGAPLSCPSLWIGHLKNKKANHEVSKRLKCAGIVHTPSRWSWSQYDSQITVSRRQEREREQYQRICERPRDYCDRCRSWTCPEEAADTRDTVFYHEVHGTATGRNAFAIDFWANPIAQAQIRDYKARTLHPPEVKRHAEVPPHQVLNNAANSRVNEYIQNLQFQILMQYKLTILSIQHVLEGNTKETLIDLVGMSAALLRFAERSTYIRIHMKEGAQGAQQFDPGYNGVMSHAIQPLHALSLIQGQGSQDLVNPQAGQYSATAMGPGQQIPQLVTFTPTQIIQQFYSGQLIPRPQIQQPFQGFGMYPGIQQFQGFPQPGLFQQTQPSSGQSIQLNRQPSITEGLPQFMQSSPTFGVEQTQQSNLLTPPAPSSAGHPAFQSSFQIQNPEQLNQQYNQLPTTRPPTLVQQQNQVQEPRYVNGRLINSPATALTRRISQDYQQLWNRVNSQRTDQSQFTPIDPPELTINMTQQQFNVHRDFWAQRSYALRYIRLRSNGQRHKGFGEGLLNVSAFIQRHARHEYLSISEWKSFWREVDTDLYLDTVRMKLDEDDQHYHHHDYDHDHDRNHRYERYRNDRNEQLDLRRGRKRRRVISSESSGNGQNNDDWAEGLYREIERQQLSQFRIRRDRREQALSPVQTVTGAPVYMPGLRAVQDEVFRVANNISPNLDKENSVSWTSIESINQERDTPIANFRTAQQLLAAQDNQEQLNQQVNIQIQQQINQLQKVNKELQIQQQDVTVNSIQNEQRQQVDIIDLEQNTQQQIEEIPKNEQGNTNNETEEPTQTGAIHTLQTEASNNLQYQQTGQNDDLNNMAEQNPLQPVESFPGLLNLTHQASLSETGSLNEQQQQLSLSLSPSSSSLIQIKQNQQPSQKQSLFVTDPNHQFISGVQQSKYIPIEQAVNHLQLFSEDHKRQVEIKVYTGEQVQYINKMEQDDKFLNMMDNMMNELQNNSNEDESVRLRMQILNKLSPEEQQRVKRGFGSQMRLMSFYEFQIQRKITQQNDNAIQIDTGWDFGSGTGEQQDEFQEDFMDESQLLEIRPLGKNSKKYNHLGPLFSQMNYPGPPGRAPDQTNTKLRSRQPTSRRQKIVSLTQTTPQSKTTPYPNQNQSSILNVDLMGIITNPFSVPKKMQHQLIAGEEAQVFHAPRGTFSINESVERVASSTDSIASGQVGVAGTKPTNIQTAPSTQLQGNPVREPKVGKKGGRTPVGSKATSTNTSVVANWNQSEDQQR
ncbi:MAG: hypothetical protein EZS28_015495, partial [Streblomastix strix]